MNPAGYAAAASAGQNGADFQQILRALLSTDNSLRNAAEQKIDELQNTAPDALVLALAAHSAQVVAPKTVEAATRELALVLLRRVVHRTNGAILEKLSPQSQQDLRNILLTALNRDDDPVDDGSSGANLGGLAASSARRKLCDAVAIVAAYSDVEDAPTSWRDLFTEMFANLAPHHTPGRRVTALEIVARCANHVVDRYDKDIPIISAALLRCLAETEPVYAVRITALKAITWMLSCLMPDSNEALCFSGLVLPTLDLIRVSQSRADYPTTKESLSNLVEIAESHSSFFRKQNVLSNVVGVVYDIAVHRAPAGDGVMAFELLTTLAEQIPKACKRLGGENEFTAKLLEAYVTRFLLRVSPGTSEALEAWGSKYDVANHDEDDEDEGVAEDEELGGGGVPILPLGLEYVDRLVRVMKTKKVVAMAFSRVASLLTHADAGRDWRYRQAGLLLASQVCEMLTPKGTEPQTGECVSTAAAFSSQDAHAKVRYAGVTFLSRLALDCAPAVQKAHAGAFLDAVVRRIVEDPVPRIRAHACIALSMFAHGYLNHYSDPEEERRVTLSAIMGGPDKLKQCVDALFHALTQGPQCVQETALLAIAAIAESCTPEEFAPLYALTVPPLKQALHQLPPTAVGLKAHAVNCITLIGTSVGPTVFRADATELADTVLMPLMSSLGAMNLGEESQLLMASWMRIAHALGEDFTKYLHAVMPQVLTACRTENEGEDDEEEGEAQESSEANPNAARTSRIDDQLMAMETLDGFASTCGGRAFAPFICPALSILVTSLEDSWSQDVRSFAASVTGDLIASHANASPPGSLQEQELKVFTEVFDRLIVALNNEDEDSLDVLRMLVGSIGRVGAILAPYNMLEPEVAAISLMHAWSQSLQRRAVAAMTKQLRAREEEEEAKASARRAHEEEEDEDEDDFVREYKRVVGEEHDLHFVITTAFTHLLKSPAGSAITRALILPDPQGLGRNFFDLTTPGRLLHDRQMAVFVLCDVVELIPFVEGLGGDEALAEQILTCLLAAASTTEPTLNETLTDLGALHQAAWTALGFACETSFRTTQFWNNGFYSVVASTAAQYIAKCPPRLRTGPLACGVDNAASVIMKCLRNRPAHLETAAPSDEDLMRTWHDALPVREDPGEARYNSMLLLELGVKGTQALAGGVVLTGRDRVMVDCILNPNTPCKGIEQTMIVLASVVGTEALTDEASDEALNFMLEWKARLSPAAWQRVVGSVEPEDMQRIVEMAKGKGQ